MKKTLFMVLLSGCFGMENRETKESIDEGAITVGTTKSELILNEEFEYAHQLPTIAISYRTTIKRLIESFR